MLIFAISMYCIFLPVDSYWHMANNCIDHVANNCRKFLSQLWKYFDEGKDKNCEGGNIEHNNAQVIEVESNVLDIQTNEMQQDCNIDTDSAVSADSATQEEEIQEEALLAEKSDLTSDNQSQEGICRNLENASCSIDISDQNSPVTIKQSLNMTDYLAWPESPKRKGKRQTERFPYAITSRQYQEMYEKKNIAKLKAEEEKEKRKKEREEKKAAAVAKKDSKKTKTKMTCIICKRLKADITCDNCNNFYHIKCIPKSHQQHAPDLEDNDLFVCHNCYNEDETDDESDPSVDISLEELSERENFKENLENENNHTGNNEKDEDEFDVDELYQLYITNKDK